MSYVILSILSLALGFYLGRKSLGKEINIGAKGELEKINAESQTQKEERKGRILGLFQDKESVTNDNVQALLGVSDATATNYLSELEKEGKIFQEGSLGRFVTYRLKG
jgi:Fic family protein